MWLCLDYSEVPTNARDFRVSARSGFNLVSNSVLLIFESSKQSMAKIPVLHLGRQLATEEKQCSKMNSISTRTERSRGTTIWTLVE